MLTDTPRARYAQTLKDLDARAKASAARAKVTLWSYYLGMWEDLQQILGAGKPNDLELVRRCRAVVRRADERCGKLGRAEAARLWALSIYCARIAGITQRRSPEWLRARAGVRRAVPGCGCVRGR